jgi:hypothetical protein
MRVRHGSNYNDRTTQRRSTSVAGSRFVPMMLVSLYRGWIFFSESTLFIRIAQSSFFLESTFKDQINPKRQTAGPPEGGSPELDLEPKAALADGRGAPLGLTETGPVWGWIDMPSSLRFYRMRSHLGHSAPASAFEQTRLRRYVGSNGGLDAGSLSLGWDPRCMRAGFQCGSRSPASALGPRRPGDSEHRARGPCSSQIPSATLQPRSAGGVRSPS